MQVESVHRSSITYRPVYEQILKHCRPLQFQPPWDFLKAQPNCLGPVANPTAVLAELREHYDDAMLLAAGVLDVSGEEGPHPNQLFTGADAALIALRGPSDGALRGLLHERGCLPRKKISLDLVQKDGWTQQALLAHGVLFATPEIREVALLQALGLPATLSVDLRRLPLSGLANLNTDFKKRLRSGFGTAGPTLALVGCSLLSLDSQPSPALAPAVEHLTRARNYLDLNLSGVMALRVRADDLDNLRLRFRKADTVQNLLLEAANNIEDIATLLPPSDVGIEANAESGRAYAEAQANLLALLAGAPTAGPLPERVRRAMETYEQLVQSTLIAPLLNWALSSKEAVLRNAGVQLTTVCHLLHRMSPLLLAQQTRQFGCALATGSEPLPTEALSQYLTLTARFSNLLRDLWQWRNT